MDKLRSNAGWLSRLVPFGLVGQTKPHHYREMLGIIWENKTELPYAWNILKHGVCDGCSLGPYGLREVGKSIGLSASTVSRFLSGGDADGKNLDKLAAYLEKRGRRL